MSDDKSNRGTPDSKLISLREDYEVRYWTKELGVSKERLEQLVRQHGNSAARIREVLGK
ncbi:MAG: DUF3606 domain-containing protein [Terriglobales bacterium]|jgi:Protein of unknown function (DUF3606)